MQKSTNTLITLFLKLVNFISKGRLKQRLIVYNTSLEINLIKFRRQRRTLTQHTHFITLLILLQHIKDTINSDSICYIIYDYIRIGTCTAKTTRGHAYAIFFLFILLIVNMYILKIRLFKMHSKTNKQPSLSIYNRAT